VRGRKRTPARGSRHREPPRNKAGIRRLEGDEDLWGHFLAAEDEGPPDAREPEQSPPAGRRPPLPQVAADRHGIPRLDESVDLPRLLAGALQDPDEAAELGEVFRRSLQQDARSLMKQKTGGRWAPRRLTLKEQLRRYPAPQAQLDLHGATALKARQRAESFVRTAAADGRLTLRLIVGKGLHSADGAVLPDVIEDLLLALKRESLVLTFDWDKGVKRKSGAVIVYLTGPF
jgi:DNA-nicking Smr family endonuclease